MRRSPKALQGHEIKAANELSDRWRVCAESPHYAQRAIRLLDQLL
jgi:hypothetical protein